MKKLLMPFVILIMMGCKEKQDNSKLLEDKHWVKIEENQSRISDEYYNSIDNYLYDYMALSGYQKKDIGTPITDEFTIDKREGWNKLAKYKLDGDTLYLQYREDDPDVLKFFIKFKDTSIGLTDYYLYTTSNEYRERKSISMK